MQRKAFRAESKMMPPRRMTQANKWQLLLRQVHQVQMTLQQWLASLTSLPPQQLPVAQLNR
jgi:hypothetical protein